MFYLTMHSTHFIYGYMVLINVRMKLIHTHIKSGKSLLSSLITFTTTNSDCLKFLLDFNVLKI